MREPEEEPLTRSELELGEALARLKPAATSLDPNRIRLEAQRRRDRRDVWLWRGIAAALALALMLSILFHPRPRTIERLVYVSQPARTDRLVATTMAPGIGPEPMTIPAAAVREDGDYLAVRSRVVAFGVRVLPPPAPAPSPDSTRETTTNVPAPAPARTLLDWLDPLPREGRS